jgi:hypothetical protein
MVNYVGMQKVAIVNTPDSIVITVDKPGNVFPRTFTLDFGTVGVKGKKGNILKGKIFVVVSNRMDIANSTRTLTFNNFSVNDNAVKGSKIVKYNGDSPKKNWTITLNDTVIKAADGKTIISNSIRTRTLISDNGTPKIYADDSYSIEGSATGINAKGIAFKVLVTKPLITDGLWPVFVEGTISVTTEKRSAILDFGDGERDLIATTTINGVTKTITLRK